jgi:hypothetical protein
VIVDGGWSNVEEDESLLVVLRSLHFSDRPLHMAHAPHASISAMPALGRTQSGLLSEVPAASLAAKFPASKRARRR